MHNHARKLSITVWVEEAELVVSLFLHENTELNHRNVYIPSTASTLYPMLPPEGTRQNSSKRLRSTVIEKEIFV